MTFGYKDGKIIDNETGTEWDIFGRAIQEVQVEKMTDNIHPLLAKALWKIYRRPERPEFWTKAGDFHWVDPQFSQRVLREHLDETHGAASRVSAERNVQIDWMWQKLHLKKDDHLFDITCGPGLYAVEFARRGCVVTGIDYSPTSIAYARELAAAHHLSDKCTFIEQDIRAMADYDAVFDAAILLYGQLSAFSKEEAQSLLARIARSLKPGSSLCIELLDQDMVDKTESTWWFTDDKGLWGDAPFLHLGERFWNDEEENSVERYHVIHLETGELTEILMYDQSYAVDTMTAVLKEAGFRRVEAYLSWDDLPLYDAIEWVAYVATK